MITVTRRPLFIAGLNSAVSFEVLLSRRVGNAVLTMYVPSSMLVIVSWLSLWVRDRVLQQHVTNRYEHPVLQHSLCS